MTVTHRKPTLQQPADDVQAPPLITEPGVLFECDSCGADITHTIRIRCAAPGCEEVDLCPSCFCAGKEVGRHKAWHDYRVVESHSYPIFTEDWGADEELLLIEGLMSHGLGNWSAAAEHVGTRTKEEVKTHYEQVYHDSDTWPLPRVDPTLNENTDDFHARRKQRISSLTTQPPKDPPAVYTSAPTNHEILGFMPGRLEFDTEVENDAEDMIKDLEFGLVMQWGGADQPEAPPPPIDNDNADGDGEEDEETGRENLPIQKNNRRSQPLSQKRPRIEPVHSPPADPEPSPTNPFTDQMESPESVALKVSLIEVYNEKVDKREEAKTFVFDHGFLEFKKMQAAEKKRPKEEREFINKHKPFAKLQTAEDFETMIDGFLYEMTLRRKIAELQEYRRMGISTLADVDRYEKEKIARAGRLQREYSTYGAAPRAGGRHSLPPTQDINMNGKRSREGTPKPQGVIRRPPAPLNLANASSLHLLTPAEQTLCSQLRILPKPFLVIKETLVSEFAKRGGKLRRREARDLIKIDVNKTSRIWDFLVLAGVLKVPSPVEVKPVGGSVEEEGAGAVAAPASNPPAPTADQSAPMEVDEPESSNAPKVNGIVPSIVVNQP